MKVCSLLFARVFAVVGTFSVRSLDLDKVGGQTKLAPASKAQVYFRGRRTLSAAPYGTKSIFGRVNAPAISCMSSLIIRILRGAHEYTTAKVVPKWTARLSDELCKAVALLRTDALPQHLFQRISSKSRALACIPSNAVETTSHGISCLRFYITSNLASVLCRSWRRSHGRTVRLLGWR